MMKIKSEKVSYFLVFFTLGLVNHSRFDWREGKRNRHARSMSSQGESGERKDKRFSFFVIIAGRLIESITTNTTTSKQTLGNQVHYTMTSSESNPSPQLRANFFSRFFHMCWTSSSDALVSIIFLSLVGSLHCWIEAMNRALYIWKISTISLRVLNRQH